MSVFLILLYHLSLCCFSQAHQFDTFSFDYHASLDASFDLYWQVKPSYLRLGMVVNSSGWFGFGLSPNGGMWGSDIMLVRTSYGQVSVSDRKARDKNAVPEEDVKTFVDWQVVFATFSNNKFHVEVLREFDTKDEDDIPIVPGEMRVIWARNSVNELVHHEARGSAVVTFLSTNTTSSEDPSTSLPTTNASVFSARLATFVVPPDQTSARCANFVFPSNTQNHGIVFTPLVGNAKIVKSILVLACVTFPVMFNISSSSSSSATTGYACESPSLMGCESLVYTWSVGGNKLVLPSDAGMLFGGANGIKNLVLQVRYERSSLDTLTDNSGFEITYTPRLRPNHAGYIKLGSYPSHIQIPANKTNYAISNNCSLTSSSFPQQQQKLNVITNTFHMHAYGTRVWSAHFRNGRFVSTLGKNLYWNFLLEGTSSISPFANLLPADEIVTTCVYSTMGQSLAVTGGDASKKEQCFNFLLVYPLPVNFTSCMSDKSSLRDFNGVYPWQSLQTKSAQTQEDEDYETFRRNVVIMNQVMSALSLLAASFMIACWFLFRDLRTFAFHLILMMAIADFWNCFGALFGRPNEGVACEFQSWMLSYWSLASILWTSSIAFTLHMAFIKQREAFSPGNIESKRRPFHLFCWGVPFILTVLPAFTDSFGQDYAFCWIVDEGLPHVAWRFIQFYVPLWIAFGYNAFVYVQVFRKLRQQDSPPALLVRLTLYPLILVICWFPDTLANLGEAFGFGGPWFEAFAAFFSASNGLLNALVYGLTADVRTRLCCRNRERTEPEQDTSVQKENI